MLRTQRKAEHRGIITFEFIVALPIILIAMFAVFQFSLYFAGSQHVALASRVGAEAASQIPLPNPIHYGAPPVASEKNQVPEHVVEAVKSQLITAGIEPCALILEHNILEPNTLEPHGKSPHHVLVTELSPCSCEPPAMPLPPESVRLTVCIRLTEVMPNCLASFGFDIGDKTAQQTTVFRYELSSAHDAD